jgi:hypothetical protein
VEVVLKKKACGIWNRLAPTIASCVSIVEYMIVSARRSHWLNRMRHSQVSIFFFFFLHQVWTHARQATFLFKLGYRAASTMSNLVIRNVVYLMLENAKHFETKTSICKTIYETSTSLTFSSPADAYQLIVSRTFEP